MTSLLCGLLNLYMLLLLGRAILSFFPIGPDSSLWSVQRALMSVTEPVLAPMRRVIPPLGMFDMSFLVLFIALQLFMVNVLHCSGLII